MDIALTRAVARSLERCELTFLEREPIDVGRAQAQHAAYCDALESAGLEVLRLPADDECPDCCFVEDTAVVLDEVAIATSPGTASRTAEVEPVARTLARYRPVERIAPPATLEGGDVLRVGRRLFAGRTARTNDEGIAALRRIVAAWRYEVVPVGVTGCLHLKTAITALDDATLFVSRPALDCAAFRGLEVLDVPPDEPGAANVLRVRGEVWVHAGFPRALDLLARRGYRVRALDVSEFLKAEAGLTCKSLLFRR